MGGYWLHLQLMLLLLLLLQHDSVSGGVGGGAGAVVVVVAREHEQSLTGAAEYVRNGNRLRDRTCLPPDLRDRRSR